MSNLPFTREGIFNLQTFETGGKLSQFDWPFETELNQMLAKRCQQLTELF